MSQKYIDLFLSWILDSFLAVHVEYAFVYQAKPNPYRNDLLEIQRLLLDNLSFPERGVSDPESQEFAESIYMRFDRLRGSIIESPLRRQIAQLQNMFSMSYAWAISGMPTVVVPGDVSHQLIRETKLPTSALDYQVPGINEQACVLYQFPGGQGKLPDMMLFLANAECWFPSNVCFGAMFPPSEQVLMRRGPLTKDQRELIQGFGVDWFPRSQAEIKRCVHLSKLPVPLNEHFWFGISGDVNEMHDLSLDTLFKKMTIERPAIRLLENSMKVVHGLHRTFFHAATQEEKAHMQTASAFPCSPPRVVVMKK